MIIKVRKNTNDKTRELFEAGYNIIVSDFNAGGDQNVTNNWVTLYEREYSERYPMNAIDTALKDIALAGYYVWFTVAFDGRIFKITESNVRPDSSCTLLYSIK